MIDYYPPFEPGICYHIYNRGNNRCNIFYKPENYLYFLDKYGIYMTRVVDTFVYNLLPNHFHIVIRVKNKSEIEPAKDKIAGIMPFPTTEDLDRLSVEAIVSELFRRFLMAYAKAINKQEGRIGSLFQHHLKRRPVESDTHFQNLIYYVHTNAQLHGLCSNFLAWPYSSYQAFCSNGVTKLNRAAVLKYFASIEDFISYHQQYINLKNIETIIIED
jgi:putative transposase